MPEHKFRTKILNNTPLMSLFREIMLTYMHKNRNHTLFGVIVGVHIPVVGTRSDFELRDFLKKASLITSTTPHWKRTRVLAGQIWTRDLWSLTYLPGTEKASAGSDKTIGRCTHERGKTMSKAWGKSLPEDLTANPKGGDPQVYWQICTSSTQGGRVRIFFSFQQCLLSIARHRREVL